MCSKDHTMFASLQCHSMHTWHFDPSIFYMNEAHLNLDCPRIQLLNDGCMVVDVFIHTFIVDIQKEKNVV